MPALLDENVMRGGRLDAKGRRPFCHCLCALCVPAFVPKPNQGSGGGPWDRKAIFSFPCSPPASFLSCDALVDPKRRLEQTTTTALPSHVQVCMLSPASLPQTIDQYHVSWWHDSFEELCGRGRLIIALLFALTRNNQQPTTSDRQPPTTTREEGQHLCGRAG